MPGYTENKLFGSYIFKKKKKTIKGFNTDKLLRFSLNNICEFLPNQTTIPVTVV